MSASIEVITIPIADVDRSIAFYRDKLGFTLDVDWSPHTGYRVVQLTPPGSATSIQLGIGLTTAEPGTMSGIYLVTPDIALLRNELKRHDVAVSGFRHKSPPEDWQGQYAPGLDPQRRDYVSFFDLEDPDGNRWIVQEKNHPGSTHTR